MKKWALTVLMLGLMAACRAPLDLSGGATTGSTSRAASIEAFSKQRAMGHVRRLSADIGVRVRATKNERRGASYVAEKLEKFGYEVRVKKFDVDGKKSRNVTALWPGALKYPFVVGAHIDSVPGSPGANDNASGTAVMLEVARLFAGSDQAKFVKFVGFGSEEFGTNGLHHVGSQSFVNRLGKKGRKWTPAMVSVDMVADGRPLIVGTAGIGPDVFARWLYERLDDAGFGVTYQTTCDCSDNGPFERAGMPAAFMWSGDEPDYHAPSDTPPNLSKKDLVRSGRAVRNLVKALDRDLVKRFRES